MTAHSMDSYSYLRSFRLRMGVTGDGCNGVSDALGPVLFLTPFKVWKSERVKLGLQIPLNRCHNNPVIGPSVRLALCRVLSHLDVIWPCEQFCMTLSAVPLELITARLIYTQTRCLLVFLHLPPWNKHNQDFKKLPAGMESLMRVTWYNIENDIIQDQPLITVLDNQRNVWACLKSTPARVDAQWNENIGKLKTFIIPYV